MSNLFEAEVEVVPVHNPLRGPCIRVAIVARDEGYNKYLSIFDFRGRQRRVPTYYVEEQARWFRDWLFRRPPPFGERLYRAIEKARSIAEVHNIRTRALSAELERLGTRIDKTNIRV